MFRIDGSLVTMALTIDDRTSFNEAIESSGLEKEDIEGIWRTIITLAAYATEGSKLLFDAKSQCIVPRSDKPPASHLGILKELRLKAQTAAVTLSCSSILAGRSSDSDEFSDVAFYSGELEDEERLQESIITKLGLGKLIEAGEIIPVENETTGIASISAIPEGTKSVSFNEALAKLESLSEFTVELPDDTEGHIVHFAVGKYERKWCGLIAVSIQLE